MKFWSNLETSEDVRTILAPLRRKIEKEVIEEIGKTSLNDENLPEWAIIFVCVSDEFLDFFSETLVMRKKPPTIEHRLQINYEDFLAADNQGKVKLMMEVLRRSVDYMREKKFNIDQAVRDELKHVIDVVELRVLDQIAAGDEK